MNSLWLCVGMHIIYISIYIYISDKRYIQGSRNENNIGAAAKSLDDNGNF